jgi:hypothetical protein
MSKSLAVLALTLPAANAAYSWAKGTKICAGIVLGCTDVETCSKTAIGPCEGDADPTAYLESKFAGMAFVNSGKYLDPSTGLTAGATTYKVIEPTGPGFRDFKGEISDGTDKQKFAFTMVGNVMGDTNTAGGYAGIVSYLNTGTEAIETNSAMVFGASTDNKDQVDRSTAKIPYSSSKYGAPSGPHEVCISDIAADKSCGAKRSIKPDDYKFSIFGSMSGSDYDAGVVAGKNGFPAGMDKMGVRMTLKATGFEVKGLMVNGKSWDKSMVNEDVNSLFIMHATGGLNIKFPKKYNTGTMVGAVADKPLPNVATHNMQIRISTVDTTAQTIAVDYLFDTSTLKAGTWFIYDPDVTEAAKGSKNPNAVTGAPAPAPVSSSATTALVGAAALVAGAVALFL